MCACVIQHAKSGRKGSDHVSISSNELVSVREVELDVVLCCCVLVLHLGSSRRMPESRLLSLLRQSGADTNCTPKADCAGIVSAARAEELDRTLKSSSVVLYGKKSRLGM